MLSISCSKNLFNVLSGGKGTNAGFYVKPCFLFGRTGTVVLKSGGKINGGGKAQIPIFFYPKTMRPKGVAKKQNRLKEMAKRICRVEGITNLEKANIVPKKKRTPRFGTRPIVNALLVYCCHVAEYHERQRHLLWSSVVCRRMFS